MTGPGGQSEAEQFAADAVLRAFESSPDGVLILDLAGVVRSANPNAAAMFGSSGQTLTNGLWPSFWSETDRLAANAALEAATKGASSRFMASVQLLGGAERRLDTVVTPRRDAAGALGGALVVSRDVTEIEAEARLDAEMRERTAAQEASALRTVAEMANLGSWTMDCRQDVVTVDSSRTHAGAVGRSQLELSIDEAVEKYDLEYQDRLRRKIEEACQDDRPFQFEAPVTRSDGTRAWFRVFGEPVYERDVCVALRGAKLDVTEERTALETIERAEQRLQLAIELAGMEVFEIDFDRRRLTPAGAWDTILKDPLRDEDIWPDPFRAVDPRDQSQVRRKWREAVETRSPFRCEFRIHGHDGQEAWVYCAAEILQEAGHPRRAIAAIIDVTERKRRELKLLQAMAEMREHETRQRLLLNELNHRVKNTLASVQSVARQTLGAGREPQEARDLFVDRLLALSTAHDLLVKHGWTSASFRELVEATLKPYDQVWRYQGPDFFLDPNFAVTLGMAIHELATNAIKHGAWRGRGQVDIATAIVDGQARITWRESGGPLVSPPTRRGFGSRLLQRGVGAELGGKVALEFPPEGVFFQIQTQCDARLRLAECDAKSPPCTA